MPDAVAIVMEAFARTRAAQTFALVTHTQVSDRPPVRVEAAVDLRADAIEVDTAGLSLRRIGGEIFVDRGAEGWLRLVEGRLPADSRLLSAFDLTAFAIILDGVVWADQTGAAPGVRVFEGAYDLRRAVDAAPPEAQPRLLATLRVPAAVGTETHFSAEVDDAGRLTELSYVVDSWAGPAATLVQLSRFGADLAIVRPAPVRDATDEEYALL